MIPLLPVFEINLISKVFSKKPNFWKVEAVALRVLNKFRRADFSPFWHALFEQSKFENIARAVHEYHFASKFPNCIYAPLQLCENKPQKLAAIFENWTARKTPFNSRYSRV